MCIRDRFNGELSFNDERLDNSLEKMVQLMDYVNVDHAALAWQGKTLQDCCMKTKQFSI